MTTHQRQRRNHRAAFVALVLAGLLTSPGLAARTPSDDLTCRLSERFINSLQSRSGELSAFALSGGGARGAWGAGFLAGWLGSGAQPAPAIVTGVSVGALLSSHVFAGAYDDLPGGTPGLSSTFREIGDRDVLRPRLRLLWALFRNSRYANAPLENTLQVAITGELLQRIHQSSQNRLLCVATVNLRSGDLVRWDLTRLAAHYATTEDRGRKAALLALYHRILLAATAIPGVFPPTVIDYADLGLQVENSVPGDPHVDSGVRNQVVGPGAAGPDAYPFELDYKYLLEELQPAPGTRAGTRPQVNMLISGPTSVEPNWRSQARLFPVFDIAARSVQITLDQTARDSRRRLADQASDAGASCRGIAMRDDELRPTSCPAYQQSSANGGPIEALEFDCSAQLFAAGLARASEPGWQDCDEL